MSKGRVMHTRLLDIMCNYSIQNLTQIQFLLPDFFKKKKYIYIYIYIYL